MTALLFAVLLSVSMQDADTRAVLRLEDDWASALVKRDSVTFNRLLAPGFVYTENDQVMDRAEFGPRDHYPSAVIQDSLISYLTVRQDVNRIYL